MKDNISSQLTVVVLAAGKGTRMHSNTPKVMHPIGGLPMVGHVVMAAAGLDPDKIIVVLSPEMEEVHAFVEALDPRVSIAWQNEQKGTGHAVMSAREHFNNNTGTILVMFGDTPLIQTNTLRPVVNACVDGAGVSVMAFHDYEENRYGRVVVSKQGKVEHIVEFKDLSEGQEKISLCNSGVMALRAQHANALLDRVMCDNAAHEYYLTDIVGIASKTGLTVDCVAVNKDELRGINSRYELSCAERAFQDRRRKEVMMAGVTLIDPDTVYFQHDTAIGKDSVIHPNVSFGAQVCIGEYVEILPYTRIEQSQIDTQATIGPFAYIRKNSQIGKDVHVGSFIEVKASSVGDQSMIKHFGYIGDAEIGSSATIGAGTVTCNFDGFEKHKSIIGKGAFVGANVSLVAPVMLGENSIVGAGSVITEPVERDSLSVTRTPQQHYGEAAKRYRRKRMN